MSNKSKTTLTAQILEAEGFVWVDAYQEWEYGKDEQLCISYGHKIGEEDKDDQIYTWILGRFVRLDYVEDLIKLLEICGYKKLAERFKKHL